jgi:signal transduction histidine kinase
MTPIVNAQTGKYIGQIYASILAQPFFNHYGNVLDINYQYIVALDRQGTFLTAVLPASVGKNFFGQEVQDKITNHNFDVYRIYDDVVRKGKSQSVGTFDAGFGERFVVAFPVYYEGKQIMTVAQGVPTSIIYSQIDAILFPQQMQTISLFAAIGIVASILIIYLSKQNIVLDNKVKERTAELTIANHELEERADKMEKISQFVSNTNEKLIAANQELGKANDQLKLHANMQQEFINIAAHELRTPIQAILGYSDLLQIDSNAVEISEAVNAITRSAERLQKLAEDILDVTRIEGRSLKLNKETINIEVKILDAIADAKRLIKNKQKIDIVFTPVAVSNAYDDGGKIDDNDCKDKPIMVEVDKIKVYQVLMNLLRNAIKFTERGTIAVSLEKQDEHFVIIRVTDSGSGIHPDIMPRLFEKFTTKSETGGIGLGLFISKAIVEAHGGKIWAENNKNGKGATFTFTLPL